MMDIPVRSAEVPLDGDVVVVCRSGGRSAQVVAYLRENGWDNVANLDGGMQDWVAAGREVVSEDGHPARVL
jgi:rhodanese-related sulfurtransferase